MKNIYYLDVQHTNPYENLALEEYVLNHIDRDSYLLFLWQNHNTIVIGQNQNAATQCRKTLCKEDQVTIVRRLSGGGAVFHDEGNLNYTFIAHEDHFNVERNYRVLLHALSKLNVFAQRVGRNDICLEGRKISGNAYYEREGKRLHHGTLLLSTDVTKMERYLNVKIDKLKDKGIDSIRARVTNIQQINPNIEINTLKKSIIQSYEKEFQLKSREYELIKVKKIELYELIKKYQSEEWNFEKAIDYSFELYGRYVWGEITINFIISENKIQEIKINTDALELNLFQRIRDKVKGQKIDVDALIGILKNMDENHYNSVILRDIEKMFRNKL